MDVAQLCQEDMAKIAAIRAKLELEREQLTIKIASRETEIGSYEQQQEASALRIATLEEQIKERDQAILDLHAQVYRVCVAVLIAS